MFSSYTILFLFAVLVLPAAWLWNAILVVYVEKQMRWREYYKASALKIDITANEMFPALWRRLFSKSGQTERFGNTGQTLSYALGKLRADNDFSPFAKLVTWVIYLWDAGHYEREIEMYEEIKKNAAYENGRN